MPTSRAGLKQIVLMDAGTLATTPVSPLAMGLRGEASMAITPHKPITDYRGRQLRNMINFKVEAKSYQPTMQLLKALINWTNMNADAQIVTVPQSAGGSVDCYKFVSDKKLGIGFEYLISADERSLKVILERAMEYERAKTFIDAADSETPVAITGLASPNSEGVDQAKYRAPYFLAFETPKATAPFTIDDIIERSLSIKTASKKSAYNTDIVDYLEIELILKVSDASVAKLITQMSKDMSTTIYMKEQNTGSFYDAFDFNANVLTQTDEFSIGDDERAITMKFSGKVPVYDVTFQFGATYGGDAADTVGAKGGTMKFGY